MTELTATDLRARLDELTVHDALRLGARLDRSGGAGGRRRSRDRGRDGRPDDLAAIAAAVEAAQARVELRRASVPEVRFPEELPITSRLDDVAAALREHQVVVVAGETGSGKSTQLPKLALALGRGVRGMVGHTQPRRLAARTVAERVASELGGEVGGTVGYAVRFTDKVGERTLVKVMTDGILLAEVQRDRLLSRYDTLIVDEAHERSLNIDFLLGYLHQLLPQRPDLKLVVTSATIDTERFSAHFGGAPIIEVSGRTYPVELRYRPIGEDPDDDRDQVQAICDAVDELRGEGQGDVLVFLSGEREIRDTADALRRLDLPATEVLPLYARLSAAEQHRVFSPHPGRRIVLATNVAETSLTVPGVRYVVDAGTARISRFSRRLKVQRLPIEPISQASANQRAGRCGRVAPGICIRLYAEEDLLARPEFTEPEVLRTNLASVILQMTNLGLGDVAAFPFVDAPDRRAVTDGVALLHELGALEPSEPGAPLRLTALGRRLARLPVDPRLGRMVLEADRQGSVREVLVLAAALSIQDVRERPSGAQRQAADELHRRFVDPDSDFATLLRLWEHLRTQQQELSSNQFRRMCQREHLHFLRVREWRDLYSQLRSVAGELGIRAGTEPAKADAVHRALLSGLLSHVGLRDGEGAEFRGARGAKFLLGRESALAKKPPRWIVVGELIETNRLWGRTAARITPEWIEALAGHLVTRTYSEPRWQPERGSAVASERVTLYGLPLVVGRTVQLSRVDPGLARTLFLRHALVEGDWDGLHHTFVAENRARLEELAELEARLRRRDVYVGDEALAAFYDARVPADVVSGRHFDRWWKDARRTQPDLLTLRLEDVLPGGPDGLVDPGAAPATWRQGELELPLHYVWEPGDPLDGVAVCVSVGQLDQLRPDGFDWGLPAWREELVVALLRSLPKELRRQLVPAADHARAFLAAHGPEDGPLLPTLAAALRASAGVVVPPAAWQLDKLPPHLRVHFAVVDRSGTIVVTSDDLPALQARLHRAVRSAVASTGRGLERTGCTDWAFGDLPRSTSTTRAGTTLVGYPTLVDEGTTVGVRVATTPEEQAAEMHAGTVRLLALTTASTRKALNPLLTDRVKRALARTGTGTVAELVADCTTAALAALLDRHGGPVFTEGDFATLRRAVAVDLPHEAVEAAVGATRVLLQAAALLDRLEGAATPASEDAVADLRAQVRRLVGPGFVTRAGTARLADVGRYLRAAEQRAERLPGDAARDRQRMAVVHALEDEHRRVRAAWGARRPPAALDDVAWMLEELRVGTFAQQLGTAFPVSEVRVRRALAAAVPTPA